MQKFKLVFLGFIVLANILAYAQEAIPEIMELKRNQSIPQDVYSRYGTEEIATTLMKWIEQDRQKDKENKTPVYDFRKSRIVIAFNLRNLEKIQANCFLNQHQTGTSNAYLGPTRVKKESEMMGLQFGLSEPEKELLPKYAYLFPDGAPASIEQNGGINADYGGIFAQFKDEVKSRATFTAGDSLIIDAKAKDTRSLNFRIYKENQIKKIYDYYWEAQIWGKVCMDDVDRILVGCTLPVPEPEIERIKKVTGKPVYRCIQKKNGYRIYSVESGEGPL